jgi:hypothetical protein
MNTESKAKDAPLAKKQRKSPLGFRNSRFQAVLTALPHCLNRRSTQLRPRSAAHLTTSVVRAVHRADAFGSRRLFRHLREPSRITSILMADLKLTCPQCGQHISCDDAWSGHQIQCPACQSNLIVPHLQAPSSSAAPAPTPAAAQPPTPSLPKLSAGSTQVPRSRPPAPNPRRQVRPRPPKTENPLVKLVVIAVLLAAIGGIAYLVLPGVLKQVRELDTSKPATPASSPAAGGGPLGEVNEAMDVSDALDGNSPSPSRRAAAKPPAAAQPSPRPTTNAVANSVHKPPR